MITPTPTPAFIKRLLQQPLPNTRPPQTLGEWFADHPMIVRILSGVIGAALYAYILFIPNGHGLPFALGIALFSVLGAYELYLAVKRQGGQPSEGLGYFACIIFQLYAYPRGGASLEPYLPAALMLLVVVALLIEIVKRQPRPILNVGATLLGAIYVGWFFSYLTLLRGLNAPHFLTPPIHGTTQGEWLVFFVSGTTWLSDSGALFVGRALGRHKLAPHVSPGKTWEGSIGGMLTAMAGGLLFGAILRLPLGDAAALALLCGFVGQIGDLCESALKRDLGVKDSGGAIPGHGGILDRIDSLLFSAPIAYYTILFFVTRH
jgi:phosphatidate cytidylyltransferase